MKTSTASGSGKLSPRPAIERRLTRWLLAAALAFTCVSTWALDFRSVSEAGAVLYDSPSTNGRKLFVVSRGYPLEVIVTLENWVKVRDAGGAISWIERKVLNDKRTVMVLSAAASVHQSPASNSAVVFKAERDVVLEFMEPGPPGWIKVKHREGQSGFVLATEVWGG